MTKHVRDRMRGMRGTMSGARDIISAIPRTKVDLREAARRVPIEPVADRARMISRAARGKPETRTNWKMIAGIGAAAASAGAAIEYLFDRDRGRARRAQARSQSAAAVRKTARAVSHGARGAAKRTEALGQRIAHRRPAEKLYDDTTLAHKVESEALKHLTGRINVNAENGVIILRGEMDAPSDIAVIERAVRKVSGVREVRSLLHPAGAAAPNKADAIRASHNSTS